ncbi:MAG: GlsB/YeaQ/YmgE family stress response membrane protein [Desulfobacterales bacterium]|nr:GlsB/YeaQ/YmgE family stress response membrane protein [Desulfobacterales bacterium]
MALVVRVTMVLTCQEGDLGSICFLFNWQKGSIGTAIKANRRRPMQGISLIGFLIVGLIAGWLGGKIMRRGGFGFVGNLVVGVLGAFLGGFLFSTLGITSYGFVGALVTATAGAVVLLFIVGLIKRA